MTTTYKPYPAYKDSGVEWLEPIPENWEVNRVKALIDLRKSSVGKNSSKYQLLSLTLKGVIPRDISGGEGKIPANFDSYQKVETNDLIFCLFDIDETPRTIGISNQKGMITGAYNVYSVGAEGYSKYIYYYFLHIDSFKGLKPFYTGLRKVVRSETFSNIKMPHPSISEQIQIANFLDHETARIDTLIAKQKKLIALLKEKRQAVISHAVTKGLNPDVEMKDSGVEWLGEVPAHWSLSNLGHKVTVKARVGWKGLKADEYVERGYIFLATPNIKGKEIDFENVNYITKERYDESPEIQLDVGDVLVTKDGSTTGTTNVVRNLPSQATVNSSIAVLRPQKSLSSLYLYYFFKSTYIQNIIERMRGGMGVPHLFQADLKKFQILVPTLPDQKAIENYLEDTLPQITLLINKAKNQVELLKERRTALISAAVTGKIDLRDWQAPQEQSAKVLVGQDA